MDTNKNIYHESIFTSANIQCQPFLKKDIIFMIS